MLIVLSTFLLVALAAVLCAADEGGAPVAFVSNFRDEAEVSAFKVTGARAEWTATTEDGARIEGVALEVEAVKGGAMHLVLTPGETFTTLEYTAAAGMPSDWSGYDTFAMNFENGSEFMINMHLTIEDGDGANYFADNLWICRSRNRLEIPTAEFRTAEGEPIDLVNVTRLFIEIRSGEKFERDLWLYQFHLARGGRPVVEPSEGTVFVDFAPLGAAVMPGAQLVTEKTPYAAWRRCGWTSGADGLMSTAAKKDAAVISNWVWGDLSDGPAVLRVDLPDGSYRGRFYGGNYNEKIVPVRSFALSVGGEKVAAKAVDAATYYSADGHFLGIDEWFVPGEDPYEKFIKPFYQEYDFEFEAKGGYAEFTWEKTLAAFGLLVAPADGFDAAVSAVEDARRKDLADNLHWPEEPVTPQAASATDKERGFVIWEKPHLADVGVSDRPSEDETSPAVLKVTAARGERESASFVVTPLEDLGEVTVTVGDLKSEDGAVMPASAVDVRVLKYVWSGWPASVEPGVLMSAARAPGYAGANLRWYLTVTPPDGTPAGVYTGKVVVSAGNGGLAEMALEATVRPFALVEEHDVSYSWWRCSPYNMNYCLKYFLPEKMDYFRALLDAEAAHLVARGCNAYCFTAPTIKGVEGEKVNLDFMILEEEAAACLKHGLCGPETPGMVFVLPDIARYLMKETRYGDYMEPEDLSYLPDEDRVEEFSDLFNARYLDVVRQLHDFFTKKGLNVAIYPSDEPRERNTNRWNRNIADTIRYCDMIRENVPGARIYVDPMRDENSGVDYLHLVDHVDVLSTHPWDQSGRFIEHCRAKGEPDLAYFNAIMWDRYDFGFQVAAAGARWFWQWHYQWDLVPFQPFHPGFKWGVTIPGPDGPIDRPRIELVAEAIDDYRYVATLRDRIAKAKAVGKAAEEVAAAEKILKTLLDSTQPYPTREDYRGRPRKARDKIGDKTLDQWRDVLAEHIAAIDAAS
ncbi:MAG: hypothetical protein ACYTAN_11065 [Planctomycetota bacterium]